jgi:hypothetical protein
MRKTSPSFYTYKLVGASIMLAICTFIVYNDISHPTECVRWGPSNTYTISKLNLDKEQNNGLYQINTGIGDIICTKMERT